MKKAVLIGINYRNKDSELKGCINDIIRVRDMLLTKGYKSSDIKVLTDDTSTKPTRENILVQLVSTIVSSSSTSVYIHYSGHGTFVLDESSDESDGRDECIVPLDYEQSGLITDDELRNIINLAQPTKTITCVFDSCHSGTVLDLGYQVYSDLLGSKYIVSKSESQPDTRCEVVLLSGCQDWQYSYETKNQDEVSGILTNEYLDIISQGDVTYEQLISRLRKSMTTKVIQGLSRQIPNLTFGKFTDLKKVIVI